jgi:Flp pilus assembly protein TadG
MGIMLKNQKAERKKYCQGQAIVEFAVVLPILLLLMLGLINLGVLINAQIILTQAAWEGARRHHAESDLGGRGY